jgi:nucleotide-binding universal stress UspA family protein
MVVHVRRILVPTDFSEPADAALRFAVELATRVEAEVILVHAWQLSAFASRKSALARGIERDLAHDLDALALRGRKADVAIRTQLLFGAPATEIVRAAKRLRCDLIVMGTTGRTRLPLWLVGSVAQRVTQLAPCPVLTVRGGRRTSRSRARAVAV